MAFIYPYPFKFFVINYYREYLSLIQNDLLATYVIQRLILIMKVSIHTSIVYMWDYSQQPRLPNSISSNLFVKVMCRCCQPTKGVNVSIFEVEQNLHSLDADVHGDASPPWPLMIINSLGGSVSPCTPTSSGRNTRS